MGNNNEKEYDDISEENKCIFLNDFFIDPFDNSSNNKEITFHISKNTKKKRQIKLYNNNIINKINAHFFNTFIIDLIKNNSIKKDISLKKLSHNFIAKLNKKNTERLLDMKISDILSEQEISPKYGIYFKDHNRRLIDKIYEEKKEINVIKILELTFEELFIIYRRKLNDSEDIKKLEEIKDKIKGLDLLENIDKYKDFEYFIKNIKNRSGYTFEDNYVEKIKKVCLDYEKRFHEK